LSHFDLGDKPQGKSPRKSSGRRSGQNSSSTTLVDIVNLSRKTVADQTEVELGGRVSIGERSKMKHQDRTLKVVLKNHQRWNLVDRLNDFEKELQSEIYIFVLFNNSKRKVHVSIL
jgi:hypothetical protein